MITKPYERQKKPVAQEKCHWQLASKLTAFEFISSEIIKPYKPSASVVRLRQGINRPQPLIMSFRGPYAPTPAPGEQSAREHRSGLCGSIHATLRQGILQATATRTRGYVCYV